MQGPHPYAQGPHPCHSSRAAAWASARVCAHALRPVLRSCLFRRQVKVQPVYDENDELAAFMSMLTEVDETTLLEGSK